MKVIIPLVLLHDAGCEVKINKMLEAKGIDINKPFTAYVDGETHSWIVEQGAGDLASKEGGAK